MANDIEKVEENMSERFTAAVLKEFGTNTGAIKPTEYQKSLVQGYFIAVDHMLSDLESERERKNNKNTKPIATLLTNEGKKYTPLNIPDALHPKETKYAIITANPI